jgi:predicted unusual protein kinase regulating ubiquinone biosynthesis (AarF/ABC1/UbiB family)
MILSKIYHLYSLYSIYKNLYEIQNSNIIIKDCIETKNKIEKLKTDILSGGCLEIKFAQWFISKSKSNTDKNSQYLVEYFKDIFEQCPKHEIRDTFLTFKEDFNMNIQEIIQINTLECFASGSVGQVYKARLIKPIYIIDTSHKNIIQILENNNISVKYVLNDIWINYEVIPDFLKSICKKIEWVAIKVKHPKVNDDVNYKIECFNVLKSLQNYQQIKNMFSLHVNFDDFINNIIQQIDFNNEYKNCKIFRENYLGNYLNEFPRVLWSSYNITITEYIASKEINSVSEYIQLKACLNLGCSISQMVLIDNFIHGDVHDKNWGIISYSDNEIQNEPKIIYYDYGICFSNVNKLNFNREMWEHFENANIDKILESTNEMIVGNYNPDDIKQELDDMLQHYRENSLDIINLMYGLNNILEKHDCKLSSILLNLIVILSLIDATLKKQNLIGRKTTIRKNHHIELRNKALDMIAYCSSKKIFTKLNEYLKEKRKRISKLDTNCSILAFGANTTLELDLPE